MARAKKPQQRALVWTNRDSQEAVYLKGVIVKEGRNISVRIGGDSFEVKSINGAKELIELYMEVRAKFGIQL